MKRAWLTFWFNDYTRIVLVVFGGHLLLTAPIAYCLITWLEWSISLRDTCLNLYLLILGWALIDNDYGKLERLPKRKGKS